MIDVAIRTEKFFMSYKNCCHQLIRAENFLTAYENRGRRLTRAKNFAYQNSVHLREDLRYD